MFGAGRDSPYPHEWPPALASVRNQARTRCCVMNTAPTKRTAPCLAKAQGAESQKPIFKETNNVNAITHRRPAAMPPMNTAARVALVALVAAGPAGLCPQQFFDDTGLSLRHAVHDLRRRRWRIESRWSRQRVECEMTYVLTEVRP